MTMDFEMGDKTDTGNSSRTGTSYLSTTFGTVNEGTEKSKYKDSYISPNGMVTSQGVIGMSLITSQFIYVLNASFRHRESKGPKKAVYGSRGCGRY